jgi:tRNA(Ile)-lysidine synthase
LTTNTPLHAAVRQAIIRHRLVTADAHLVVGVSGGSDSVALLHLLADLLHDCRLTAVYIDHGLRPEEAIHERQLVEDHCRRLAQDCRIVAVDVMDEQRRSGESLEACGRRLRYRALEQVRTACGAESIAVGHTSDDQAEEVLIRLIRGTGIRGLAGMTWKNGRVIRPLLEVSKEELANYLHSRGIASTVDSSNLSTRFLRNRVRLELLPLLERGYNSAIRKTLRNMAAICAGDDDYLRIIVDSHYGDLVSGTAGAGLTLSLAPFGKLHQAMQRRLLEKICWQSGSRPSFQHIEGLLQCITSGKNGARLDLPGSVWARKTGHTMVFSARAKPPRDTLPDRFGAPLTLDGPGIYPLPQLSASIELALVAPPGAADGGVLLVDAALAPFPLVLRAPAAGERFVPLGAPGSKKVNRLLSDRKIPRHRRHRHPVLACGPDIIAIPGLVISDHARISEQTRRVLAIAWRNEEP